MVLLLFQVFKISVLLVIAHLLLIDLSQFKLLLQISQFALLFLFLELDLIIVSHSVPDTNFLPISGGLRGILDQKVLSLRVINSLIHVSRSEKWLVNVLSCIVWLLSVIHLELIQGGRIELLGLFLVEQLQFLHCCGLFDGNSLSSDFWEQHSFWGRVLVSMSNFCCPRLLFQNLSPGLNSRVYLVEIILRNVLFLSVAHEIEDFLVDFIFKLAAKSNEQLFSFLSNNSIHSK